MPKKQLNTPNLSADSKLDIDLRFQQANEAIHDLQVILDQCETRELAVTETALSAETDTIEYCRQKVLTTFYQIADAKNFTKEQCNTASQHTFQTDVQSLKLEDLLALLSRIGCK
jgi:hypothetical protein